MTAEILNHIHAEPQNDFMLRDILPGAGWAPYIGRELTFVGQSNRLLEVGADEGGLNGLQFAFPFEA
ncbi:MAG: hypothetical protein ABSF28_21615 [Terracidiphilus sp.]|jgi:hypothetical protein